LKGGTVCGDWFGNHQAFLSPPYTNFETSIVSP